MADMNWRTFGLLTVLSTMFFTFYPFKDNMITLIDSKWSSDLLKTQLNMKIRENNSWIYEENLFQKQALNSLRKLIRSRKFSLNWLVEITAGDSHRVDIAHNFFKIGGFGAIMESREKMTVRLFSFRQNLLSDDRQEMTEMLGGKTFLDKSRQLCPDETTHIDLIELDAIIMLPGQEFPMHLNIPDLYGNADQRQSLSPSWLTVAMKRSGLFDNFRYIPQIQGVAWLSKHQTRTAADAGYFYFYPVNNRTMRNQYAMVKTNFNSAILLDGINLVHGVERFKRKAAAPSFEENKNYYLVYDSKMKKWTIVDEQETSKATYSNDDVRMSLVWKVNCLNREQQEQQEKTSANRTISLESILEVFKEDLKKRKRKLAIGNKLEEMNRMDFYKLIIDVYINYPNNKYDTLYSNYCMLIEMQMIPDSFSLVRPFLKAILNVFC